MNKKGFTVVELIVSFSLTMIVVALLFQMLLSLKDLYISSGFKSQLLNKQALMSSKINNDLKNKKIIIALKCGDNCLNFFFDDNTSSKLIVDNKNNIFSYGDYTTKLVDGSKFGNFDIRNEKVMGLDLASNYDSFIEIKIPISHVLLKEDYGINMVYQYNSSTSSISDIVFNSSGISEDKIVFKGSSSMYHMNNAPSFVDPGYFVYRSDGTVVDMSADVTITGSVGTTVGTTYDLVYTLRDGSSNILDVATREVTVVRGLYQYDYTGNTQTFNVPFDGTYQFEAWGAQGALVGGGRGAYTSGNVYLTKGTNVFIYVGQNLSIADATSFNGGTASSGGHPGGGATDFRLTSGTWNNTTSLRSRIMVAAGGGTGNVTNRSEGGALVGLPGNIATGGTQTTGGVGQAPFVSGLFGSGGNGCGGGGGYYGGAGAWCVDGGGGGSSFISGHPGSNAINSSGVHTNSSTHFSGYVFSNTSMVAGNASMPNPRAAGNITGNTGNGYARITLLSVVSKYNDDTIPPVITLTGASTVTYVAGTTTAYSDLGATAIDNLDGDVSGNIVTTGSVPNQMGTYTITYTAFDSNGNTSVATRTVNVTQLQTEVLVVAGGGGATGSPWGGGGGGAGGILHKASHLVNTLSSNTATVGLGGAAGTGGQNSLFGLLTAFGGGPSNGSQLASDRNGGSGGGGGHMSPSGLPSSSIQTSNNGGIGYGFGGGGTNYVHPYPHGSGGGAGGAGSIGGAGGAGRAFSTSGASVTYAGGGGQVDNVGTITAGGSGGGGTGVNGANGANGTPNTGGGGGGSLGGTGGSGGSGIIIVRYFGPQKATGGTITSVGGYTIHTFTTSGNFIVN